MSSPTPGPTADLTDIPTLLQYIANPSSSSLDPAALRDAVGLAPRTPDGELDTAAIKKHALRRIEDEFLAPVTRFEADELWMWQAPLPITIAPPSLTLSPLPPTHTVIPTTTGLDARFTGWKQVIAPPPPPPPSASSSLTRAPGAAPAGASSASVTGGTGMNVSFVRGKGSYVPFTPGGLDPVDYDAVDAERLMQTLDGGVDGVDDALDAEDDGSTWKHVIPGLRRGLTLTGADEFLRAVLGDEAAPRAKRRKHGRGVSRRRDGEEDDDIGVINEMEDLSVAERRRERAKGGNGKSDIDDLLPISRLPAPPMNRRKMAGPPKREWAHVVDVNQELVNFHELVPEMAHKYPFELDTFQKEAVYHLEMGDSVFVAAHTSAGKTVVAEYAIALAMKHMTRAIYTSPIKALSNQKFRDFKTTFEPANVGILTGDVQINPEGACLIMTTEILRSMLYKGADLIRDVEFVIFDEVHYVNDAERGVVWEEVIIMLPEHVGIILLSATVPNTKEFADWVGRTKKKDIYVISTPKRPVPLEHFLWAGKEMHKIVDSAGRWSGDGYKSAGDSLRRKQEKEREAAGLPPLTRTGGRGLPARGGAKNLPNGRGGPPARGNRGGAAPRARGGGANHMGTGSGPARSFGGQQDKQMWNQLVNHLKKIDLLPVVAFTFSKKRCEENASSLASLDLCVAAEKSEVHVTVERALTRLKGSDKKLPQIARMRELLGRGIGVHHGGLLPIVKEVVELLFARGLVKVLFATETFAMGVNMPAKSVVFSGIRKHDGHSFRTLLPGEYTQMAGRAGRRGLDTTGTVIIAGGDELPEQEVLTQMMLGTPNKLISQFRLTYNMILNLLRVEALRVEEMIKRSFSENASQRLAPEQQKQVAAAEKRLAKLPALDCSTCSPDISAFYDISAELVRLNSGIVQDAATHPQGLKSMGSGRVVLLYEKRFRGNLAVLLRPSPGLLDTDDQDETLRVDRRKTFYVLVLVSPETAAGDDAFESSEAPPLWPAKIADAQLAISQHLFTAVDTSSISLVINRTVSVDVTAIVDRRDDVASLAAMTALDTLRTELVDTTPLPEVEWSRMRSLEFQESLRARNNLAKRLDKLGCRLCSDFAEHYETLHETKVVEAELTQLKLALSDQNLELLPDYEQRVDVLKQLEFIDENSTVLLKGRVACEINSANELVLTELILENTLAQYTPAEVVALLSVFVFVEKTESVPEIPTSLENGLHTIYSIAERVEHVQDMCKVAHDDFQSKFKTGLVEVVYEWAKGMPFDQITDLTDVPEGTIVRCITRLDETCREVRDAARVIGDKDLFTKMEEAQAMIKRDIVFAASLYF